MGIVEKEGWFCPTPDIAATCLVGWQAGTVGFYLHMHGYVK